MRALLAGLLVLALAAPAQAALVYTRDGKVLDGPLKVEPVGLVVSLGDHVAVVPYDQVLGVSMDGKPLFPAPRRAEESRVLSSDWLTWTLVAANVATVLTAGVALWRLNQGAVPAGTAPAR